MSWRAWIQVCIPRLLRRTQTGLSRHEFRKLRPRKLAATRRTKMYMATLLFWLGVFNIVTIPWTGWALCCRFGLPPTCAAVNFVRMPVTNLKSLDTLQRCCCSRKSMRTYHPCPHSSCIYAIRFCVRKVLEAGVDFGPYVHKLKFPMDARLGYTGSDIYCLDYYGMREPAGYQNGWISSCQALSTVLYRRVRALLLVPWWGPSIYSDTTVSLG